MNTPQAWPQYATLLTNIPMIKTTIRHLKRHRMSVPNTQEPVWTWDSTPFGQNPANETPNGGQAFKYNLRFPGQIYDAITGHHYNYFRDYDPKLGRYMQADPIGLNGGLNRYGYVGQSPLMFIDPFGLERFYGEDRVNELLKKNQCDPEIAWYEILEHRKTYKGLREADRNAEHYLYARYQVKDYSYNWAPMHINTMGYYLYKLGNNIINGEKSPFVGSPPSIDEALSGYHGSNDGLFGGDNPCSCK